MLVPALLLTDCMLRELLAQHLLLEMRRMQMLGLTLILAFVVKDVGGHLENATGEQSRAGVAVKPVTENNSFAKSTFRLWQCSRYFMP